MKENNASNEAQFGHSYTPAGLVVSIALWLILVGMLAFTPQQAKYPGGVPIDK